MLNNTDKKTNADRILFEYSLIERLGEIGKPHIIGIIMFVSFSTI